jgi:hypothetical protein
MFTASAIMKSAIAIFPVVVLACANTTRVLQYGISAGICFHFLVAAPTVEFERYMRRFLAAAAILSGGDLAVSLFFTDRSTTVALAHLTLPWFGFVVGLLLSLIIYRLLFHRWFTSEPHNLPSPLPSLPKFSWPNGSEVDTLLRFLPQRAWRTI